MEKITASAKRMSELIQDVLDYSKISRVNVVFQPTDLNQILENVKNDYELVIKERNATIHSEPLPVIQAMPLQMHQLFPT